jgi:hypothetical protein
MTKLETLAVTFTERWLNHYDRKSSFDRELCRKDIEKELKKVINQCISQIVKVSDRYTDQYIDAALRDAAWEIEEYFGL